MPGGSKEELLVTQQLHAVQGTPRWQASDFVRLRVLGQGKYATTHLVRRQEDGVLLCNKQIALERFSTGLERIVDEVKLLMLLVDHPHIVQYVCSFVSGGMLNIVTEFADEGSLQQQLDRRRERQEPMEEADVLDIFVQTLLALEHLHSKQVLHRDLKPGNIFFDRRRMVRLGDFGIARLMGDGLVQTVIGTPLYLPPEVIQGKPYGVSADVSDAHNIAARVAINMASSVQALALEAPRSPIVTPCSPHSLADTPSSSSCASPRLSSTRRSRGSKERA